MVKVAKASSSTAQPCPLNKSTVAFSMAEPVLNTPMLSATTQPKPQPKPRPLEPVPQPSMSSSMTQSKPHPKPHPLKTSGGASSVAEPVPNTLQPSMSTLVTQPKPHPQKCCPLNQSGVPSTNPVDGAACDSKDDDSDDFFIVSHVCDSLLEKSDTSSESFVPETPIVGGKMVHYMTRL